MGDYSFFIKSASFLILLNAAIFSFPQEVEFLTSGSLNTSSIQGTELELNKPNSTSIGTFTDTTKGLIELYTTPSSGNAILAAIFTLYLLGFIVFLLKEVVPG